MARRGRPPREDGRRTVAIRIAATPAEEKLINALLTTDERRKALIERLESVKLPIDKTLNL